MDADVIVVGAGPGGSSAAYHLALAGLKVLLLDRYRFPRDKSCGDGLTRFTCGLLAEMGLLQKLPESPISRGGRVFMRGRGQRDFRYPAHLAEPAAGTVVPRVVLDELICRHAVAAGAELREETNVSRLVYSDGVVVGVEATRGGVSQELRARVVLAADGATSRLAYQAGLVATPHDQLGYAIRGYYSGVKGMTDLLEIYMPLSDQTDRYVLPSYGWVFPTSLTTANIGVGLTHRDRRANVKEVFERFLAQLREEARFAGMQLEGEWRGAPLRFDFAPERCTAPGLILVGDAAGLISPFTGEGIGYALESGRLAATTITQGLAADPDGPLDLAPYSQALARKFAGYFETGRESARRHQLIWHVLDSTFESERPLFEICRQAALFPEGLGQSYTSELFEDVSHCFEARGDAASQRVLEAQVRGDLVAVNETLIDSVRRDWPFLARLFANAGGVSGIPFRPALLLLLSARALRPGAAPLVPVSAAVELGYVAAFCQTSVVDDPTNGEATREGRVANWGNMFSLMVGDFLLSKTYLLAAEVGETVTRTVCAALGLACEGHAAALRNAYNPFLTPEESLEILGKKAATLFELPCTLGAELAGADARELAALGEYGRCLGLAHQLVDDFLGPEGRVSQLGRALECDIPQGIYSYPIVFALQTSGGAELKRELERVRGGAAADRVISMAKSLGGVAAALDEAQLFSEQARAALERLPPSPARSALSALAAWVVERGMRTLRSSSGFEEGAWPDSATEPFAIASRRSGLQRPR